MKDLINDIKTGNFKQVYLLYGEEGYLRLQYRDRLLQALQPDGGGMNRNSLSGDRISESEIMDIAETLPFFAERRVIRLDDTGFFVSSPEHLPDYLKDIPDYLVLVFTERAVDKRSRMFKAVKSAGRCEEFRPQDARTLSTWVLRMLGDEGLKIRKTEMEAFLEKCGEDMSHIRTETDKLIHYCAGRDSVTMEDILAVTTNRTENRIFDMIAAITNHRQKEALDLYTDLLAIKEPPMRILALIGGEFRRLVKVRELSGEGFSDSQIAEKAGMPPFAVRKSRRIAETYTNEQLIGCLAECAAADEAVTNGTLSDRLSVELVIMKLSGQRAPEGH